MRQAQGNGDGKTLLRECHALKGSCKNMGALNLGERCAQLERAAGDDDAPKDPPVEDLLRHIADAFARVVSALEAMSNETS